MFEITIIAVLCFCLLCIVWFTIKTGISPMPSSTKACQAILKLSEQAEHGAIIDLGCGWGTLLFALARKYPERQLIGYELSLLPYLYAQAYKAIFSLHHVSIYRQNFLTTDLPASSLIVCYLFQVGMKKLQLKLAHTQAANTLLISNTFALPDTEPKQRVQLDDLYNTPIYSYQLPDTPAPQAASTPI